MKALTMFFLCLLLSTQFTFRVTGQTKKSDQTPKTNVTEEDKVLLNKLQAAKNTLFECSQTYFHKDNSGEKAENYRKCQENANKEISQAYEDISKQPSSVFLIVSQDIALQSQDAVVRLISPREKNQIESNSNSQVELLRLIVVQNQRIIGLLEQLTKKTP